MMGSKCKMWVGMKLLVLILLFVFVGNCWSHQSEIRCWEEERLALFQLKHFFSLQNSISDCCQWEEVKCSNTTSRVIELNLRLTMNLEHREEYYLNVSLFSPFQELELLDLSVNAIAGFVESQGLKKLSKLKILNLGDNSFKNSILSSLRGVSSLRELYLNTNMLEGTIHIKGLSKLETLDLSGNLLDRNFLSSLGGLSSLRSLLISQIGLQGTFHVQDYNGLRKLNTMHINGVGVGISDGSSLLRSMGSFPSLKKLELCCNNFRATIPMIPTNMHNFASLEDLTLDASSLHISLLQSIAAFNSLKRLSMRTCEIHGISNFRGFPTFKNLEFSDMGDIKLNNNSFLQLSRLMTSSPLKILELFNSGLRGVISDQGLCELVHLQELTMHDNDLHGSLPCCLSNMTSLRVLGVSYNQLIGNMPRCLENMTSLQVLDVSYNQLTGNISLSPLVRLTSIQDLTLSNNRFQIPISLGPFYNHSNLMSFYAENNDQVFAETTESEFMAPKFQLIYLSLPGYGDCGTFPKFLYYQHELKQVDLSNNNLTGEFPNWLFENNTKLQQFLLANNSLSGPLRMPSNPHRETIILDVSNNFNGDHIPVQIGEFLPSLGYLNISGNAIDGSIPSSFGNMNSLQSLDLSNNQLIGRIPEHLAMGLQLLVLSNNNLQGHIFSKSFNLTNLVRLQVDGNYFIREIPECLSNISSLVGLYFGDNHLAGRIPRWLGNLSSLEDVIMPNNHLEGPIPIEFCQLDYLQILDLSENNISGSLPSCLGPSSIKQIHLSKNLLQGKVKDSTFCNSSSLVTLDLSYNRLFGSIPNWIDRLSQLRYLILANNNLEGEVPAKLCQLNQLRLIDLSRNNLSGQIPPCLDNTALHKGYNDAPSPNSEDSIPSCPRYYTGPPMGKEENIMFTAKEISYSYQGRPLADMFGVDLSYNKLTGKIPFQIGYLTRIHALNLSHNNLTGSIPVTFSNLKQIESMDLSYNILNGKIPLQLIKLNTLAVFSVAHNNLSGKIPDWTAQFATFNESSYDKNPLLCGLPLPKSCNENGSPPSTPKASIANKGEEIIIN